MYNQEYKIFSFIKIYINKYINIYDFLKKYKYLYIYLYLKLLVLNIQLYLIKNDINNFLLNKKLKKKIKKINLIVNNFKKLKKKKYIQKIKKKNYNLILRLKKKNLFLTFLNKKNNVLIKNNIGSFGFKKKVKFTGYALEFSTFNFAKKIKKTLKTNLTTKINSFWKKIEKLRKKYEIFLLNYSIKWFKYKIISLLKFSLKLYKKKKWNLKILNYRKYYLYRVFNLKFFKTRVLQNFLTLNLILKNNIKHWPFNYIFSGLSKIHVIISNILDKRPITHSLGFRLKKARRV